MYPFILYKIEIVYKHKYIQGLMRGSLSSFSHIHVDTVSLLRHLCCCLRLLVKRLCHLREREERKNDHPLSKDDKSYIFYLKNFHKMEM